MRYEMSVAICCVSTSNHTHPMFTTVVSRHTKRKQRKQRKQREQSDRRARAGDARINRSKPGKGATSATLRGRAGRGDQGFVDITAAEVAAVKKTCFAANVRGLRGWRGGDGRGHAKDPLEQLLEGRLAELGVARMLGGVPDFERDERAHCDLIVDGNRIEVKSTTTRIGETSREAAQRRGFTFQTHRMRGGKRVLVNPLFDPSHPHHARACAERVCGVVVLWREGHGVRIFKTNIWNIPAGELLAAGAFKEMRRPDLRPFKKAVYAH